MRSRPRPRVLPARPPAKSSRSHSRSVPSLRRQCRTPLVRPTSTTSFLNRSSQPSARSCLVRSAFTSPSRKPRIWSRPSTIVTLVPSAAKIDPYSQPITPPPRMTIARGMLSRRRIESESSTSGSSKGTNAGRCGVEPVAMITTSVETWRGGPSSGVTSSVCSSMKRAEPSRRSTWWRSRLARMRTPSWPSTGSWRHMSSGTDGVPVSLTERPYISRWR